jgi:hypothetical protein
VFQFSCDTELKLVEDLLLLLCLFLLVNGQQNRILRKVELLGEEAFTPEILQGKGVAQPIHYLEQTFKKGLATGSEDVGQHSLSHHQHIHKYNHIFDQLLPLFLFSQLLEMLLDDADSSEGHCQRFVVLALSGIEVAQVVQTQTHQHGVHPFNFDILLGLFEDAFRLHFPALSCSEKRYRSRN